MRLLTPALLTVAFSPISIDAWSVGPAFRAVPLVIQSPSFSWNPRSSRGSYRGRTVWVDHVLDHTDRIFQQQATVHSSPRYELVDNKEKFQVSLDVPGISLDNLEILVEDRHLTIRGKRVTQNQNSRSATKFSRTFSFDDAVMVDKFTASLKDGVLVVEAPKDVKTLAEKTRKIPISSRLSDEAPSFNPEEEGGSPTEEEGAPVIGNVEQEATHKDTNSRSATMEEKHEKL